MLRKRYIVDVHLSAEKLKHYYAGHVQTVSASARDGAIVHFPLNALRPFVGHAGISGTFALDVDPSNRLLRIAQI